MTFALNRRQLLGAAAAAAASSLAPVHAAQWPNRPVRIVVAFAPGGPVDLLARRIATELSTVFGQSFTVENYAGAGGRIGTRMVSQAKGDGYTLLATSSANHGSGPALYPQKELGFDAVNGFTHIGLIGRGAMALIVRADSPWRSLQDMVRDTKASGQSVHYGSAGIGSLSHLAGELTAQTLDIPLEHVAYRGSALAQIDLLAGQVPLLCDTLLPPHLPLVRSGALRVLAVYTPQRLPLLPDAPCIAELGWPQLAASSWFGLCGSPGMPKDITDRINVALREMLGRSKMNKEMIELGITPETALNARAYADFVESEVRRWTEVVRVGRIQVSA
ncbi:tripartite tricarboxylate transporter substrate binding protein [Pantoea sp. 18069]|uniref:Bug family tripartite tricarboxylate transporter substrate binding protein n=1 Tax=Pantoea sp. 18069 TaxID=2681415 RepID=UPI0013574811|nr:tripartite tricarboxylate transporter substrate binding protein [Pantoea sp. 18069]